MTPQQFLLIVWAWRKLALIVMAATVLITLVVSLLMPKAYTATTSLYLDVKTDPILGAVLPGMASPSYMATQTEIIQSSRVAGRVVKLLHIAEIPSVFQSWKEDTGGKITLEEYYGALLLRGLVVQPGRGSNIITLSYTSSDPHFAASAANAFAQATLETNIELRVDPAREYAAWFDERLKTLRDSLEKAQAKLSAYQQEHGIVASDERLDHEAARLNSLNNDLAIVQGQKADITSREKITSSELSPDVMQSGIIQGLKSELARAEAKLTEIGSSMGKNHPQKLQLEAQIEGLKQQLAMEIGRISGGVTTANRVSTQKETELRAAIEAQKKRVFELRAEHDQIDILRQDVASAQRAYDAVAARMSQATLESHSQQASLSVLSPAGEPTTPSKPKVLVNVGASVLVGLLLGVGAALGREFLDRRVRHRDDLLGLEGIPFLGVLRPQTGYQFLTGRWAAAFAWLVRKFKRRMPASAAA
jgi:chain length determinant protein EpsF